MRTRGRYAILILVVLVLAMPATADEGDSVVRFGAHWVMPTGDLLSGLFGAEAEPRRRTLPGDGIDDGALILDVEIDMAGLGHDHAPQLAADADMAKGILNGALQRARQFGYGEFVDIAARFRHWNLGIPDRPDLQRQVRLYKGPALS